MTLREQVERVLPGWRRWYPSLFDAATDLGLLRAEVCSPDSLLLSKRHEKVQRAAEQAHRERWGAEAEEEAGMPAPGGRRPHPAVRGPQRAARGSRAPGRRRR